MSISERRGLFIQTVQGGILKNLIDAVKLVKDVVLHVNSTGIKVVTMDPCKVVLLYLKLDAESFESFECYPENATYELGVHFPYLHLLLKNVGNGDVVSFEYDAKQTSHMLDISIQNSGRNSNTKYRLKLLDMNSEYREINDLKFDTVVTMLSTFLHTTCRQMSDLGADIIRVCSEGQYVTMSCEGEFASQTTVIGEGNDDSGAVITSGDANIDDHYQLSYLTLMSKAATMSKTVNMYLGKGILILEYKVASLGVLKFCIGSLANMVDE
jgi:proliferating cell nuclear antigen